MNINTRAKALIGAVAIGGAAIAMGGAFTAGGLSADGTAAQDVFIGGAVSQTVTGAILTAIDYTIDSSTDPDQITSVDLTFGESALNKTPTITFDSGTPITCGAVTLVETAYVSTCSTPNQSVAVSNVTIAVASENI